MQPVHPTTTRIAGDLERETDLVPASDPRSSVISIDPERRGGVPCFAGTRVPVQDLWDYLADNGSLNEFLDSFPTVSYEQAVQAIRMAGQWLLNGLPQP